MRNTKRALTTLVLTGIMVGAPAVGALAHECFVVNRSAKGTVQSGNSQRWHVVDLPVILVEELGVDPADVESIIADFEAAGIPTLFSVFGGPTLANRSPKLQSTGHSDGKGLDWFFSGRYFTDAAQILADHGYTLF